GFGAVPCSAQPIGAPPVCSEVEAVRCLRRATGSDESDRQVVRGDREVVAVIDALSDRDRRSRSLNASITATTSRSPRTTWRSLSSDPVARRRQRTASTSLHTGGAPIGWAEQGTAPKP